MFFSPIKIRDKCAKGFLGQSTLLKAFILAITINFFIYLYVFRFFVVFLNLSLSCSEGEAEADSRGGPASTPTSLGKKMTNQHFNQVLTNCTSQLAHSHIRVSQEELTSILFNLLESTHVHAQFQTMERYQFIKNLI